MSAYLTIPLSQGKVTLIDVEDSPIVLPFKWFAHRDRWDNWYALRNAWVDGKRTILRLHRVLLNPSPGFYVDHMNMDTLDNRRQNLRIATPIQNQANVIKTPGCTSHWKGVSWDKQSHRWKVSLRVGGHQQNLGRFTDEEEAARVYNTAALAVFGEFARLNEVPC